jgi:tetratricopeptide (TPR) repeat protein
MSDRRPDEGSSHLAEGSRLLGEPLIVHVESPNSSEQGDHVYRTLQPCRALGELPGVTVVSGSILSPEIHPLMPIADVLVLCDAVDADFAPILAQRHRAGRLSVYEINDHFLAPQSWNPTAYLAENPLTRSLSSLLARMSDGLQFTVAELDRRFGHLNPRRAVFPNHLWEVPPFRERPARHEVNVGWGGSFGHLEDIEWVAPALRRVAEADSRVRVEIMGAPEFKGFFAGLSRGRFQFTSAGNLDDYYRFVKGLDLGLCPNKPTDFNLCRSDVKFLEYAAHGVPAVCSDIAPYSGVRHGHNGFLFADPADLQQRLAAALTNPALRGEVAARAHAYVASERTERPRARDRLERYRTWSHEAGLEARCSRAPLPEAIRHGAGTRSFPASLYTHLLHTEIESLLYRGLKVAREGSSSEASRCFEQATRVCPDFYLGWVYLGNHERDPGKAVLHLRRATSLNPGSYNAACLLGSRLSELGETDAAWAELERCAMLSPEVGAAQARMGQIAAAAGRTEQATDLLSEAFAQNPFNTQPGLSAAHLALTLKQPKRARDLLEACLANDLPRGPEHHLLGMAYLDLDKPREALTHLEKALATAAESTPILAQIAKAHLQLGDRTMAAAILAEIKRLAPAHEGPR